MTLIAKTAIAAVIDGTRVEIAPGQALPAGLLAHDVDELRRAGAAGPAATDTTPANPKQDAKPAGPEPGTHAAAPPNATAAKKR
jgi:hypothetical protein